MLAGLSLNADGVIDESMLKVVLVRTYEAASQAAMLALSRPGRRYLYRTDEHKTYIPRPMARLTACDFGTGRN